MVRSYLLSILFITCFLGSCSSGSDSSELIDYETLNELTARVAMEIGESEDYLPGRLRDLVVTSDGTILVSDWASVSIEQFSAEGEHLSTIAEEGGGPGELNNFFFVYHIGNDTVMVREQSMQKKYYSKSGDGLFRHIKTISPERSTDRSITIVGAHLNGNYFATAGEIIRDIQQAAKNEIDYRFSPLVIVNPMEKILEDSVHMLKTPMAHLTRSGNGIRVDAVPYRHNDKFIPLEDNRYLIARPDSSAFFVFNADHTLDRRIPFHIKERPVTSDDLEHALKDISNNSVRSEIRSRISDLKPPYLNAWTSDNYIWLQTDEAEAGKEMVVVDLEGNPKGKFMLTEFDEVAHVEDDRVYTLHKNPELGENIRVYEVEV